MGNLLPWAPVEGYQGYYEVSSDAAVRSIDRTIQLRNSSYRQLEGRIITPRITNDGYAFVRLSKDGVTKTQYLHRLVAGAFIDNPDNLPEVNHLSGDKTDNTPANLQWVTHQQNVQHAYDTGINSNQGSGHSFAVGVIDNYLQQEFSTIKDWCVARGINYNTGRNIVSGCNTSKQIDLSEILLTKKSKTNEQ